MQIDQTLADKMVEKAIVECADFHFAGDTRRTRQALQQGSCEICAYLSDNLVRQISEYLGQIDKTVKAVYQYEPVQSPQLSQSDEGEPSDTHLGINLVAWVDRKSAALGALV